MNPDYVPWLVFGGVFAALMIFKRLGQISSAKARQLVQSGAKLVDVRSAAEFASGHIPGAVNVPVGELGAKVKSLGAKDKPVIVYCASGTRSAMARSVLKGQGFAQVFNLGSMSRW
ncbi:MAG: rhodanese-like domain-containing protein [Archangium sp.]|nr:rhodanese-like domain-containing protein [Archangium sp.]